MVYTPEKPVSRRSFWMYLFFILKDPYLKLHIIHDPFQNGTSLFSSSGLDLNIYGRSRRKWGVNPNKYEFFVE